MGRDAGAMIGARILALGACMTCVSTSAAQEQEMHPDINLALNRITFTGSQASAAASAIADTLAREFAGTFAKCDLLKRVVKAPWSAAETEAVQGGFKTLKRLQTTKFGGPAGSGVHKKDNSPPRVPGFRQRRKLHTESEPPAVQVKGETYLNAVEAAPAELLHSDLIFNLEEYAKTKNAVNKQHKSLIEECGQRDMLELYFLRNKL